MRAPFSREVIQLIENALAEDVGTGDATTLATIPVEAQARAQMVAREPMVVAGLEIAAQVFHAINADVTINQISEDGAGVRAGAVLLEVIGGAQAVLTAERVALNFVQRLSGVATLTSQFVSAIEGTNAVILDTRKTTPGWRSIEKYAVVCGGGMNHRQGLFDKILIKDNHLMALRGAKPNSIAAAVQRAREHYPDLEVEVECDTLDQVDQALDAGADILLLDNMSIDQLSEAVQKTRDRAKTEASGGVTLARVRSIAETGVDFISIGALTHSARAVDVALDFLELGDQS